MVIFIGVKLFFYYKGSKVYYEYIKQPKVPVLFLHGWGGSTESFKGFYEEGDILLDFPPFGKSQKPIVEYTLNDYVNIVVLLLRKINVDKVNIVAHSFGARVAICLAAKYNIVDRLIITAGAGIRPRFSLKKYFAKIRYKRVKKLVQKNKLNVSYLNKFGSDDYKKLDNLMKKTFVNIVNYYQNDILKDIRCDTLLVWGKDDNQTPLYMAKHIKRHIKNCQLITYEGGHFVYLEKSFAFLKIINAFLRN